MRKVRFGVCIFGEKPLPQVISQVKLAEELGYDSVWIADSQLLCRELYVTLAACAMNTSRIKLGAGVTAPHTRHVSVTASSFATLNELAQGRLLLGVSTGNSLVRTIGARPSKISDLEEYVGLLTGLLDNRPVRFEGGVEGKITWMDSPSRIPIYVAATGPRLTRAGARMADGVIIMVGVAPVLLRNGLELIADSAHEAGKGTDQIDVICWVPASVSSNGPLARQHVRRHVASLLRRVSLDTFSEEDRQVITRLRDGLTPYPHGKAAQTAAGEVPEKFIDVLALAGTPEHVRGQVERMIEVPGFSQIVLNTQVSGNGFPSLESVLRSFAEGVMTHVV